MEKHEDYGIRIEEWLEYKDFGCIPVTHKNFIVERKWRRLNWFQRNILRTKDIWLKADVYDEENKAIISMRNLYNVENPTVNYINY